MRRSWAVAPGGNDTNPGTRAATLKTLEAARDALRKLKGGQSSLAGGATVWLRGGVYRIDKTFELDWRDSGTKDAPIVYRAVPNEIPILDGGKRIMGWQPDAGKRWKAQTDLQDFRQLY